MAGRNVKRYDRAYFDRWYRDPRGRVATQAELERRVTMVLGVTEYLLERPVERVLDVGCGEGPWQPVLRRLRPAATYAGVDPSPYVVDRFGARRRITRGAFADLDALAEAHGWHDVDLVVCSDVLHYLPAAELRRGLPALAALLGGVAYLPVFTTADEFVGDVDGWQRRTPEFYRALFRGVGLVPCGMQCYVGEGLEGYAAALEVLSG